MYAEEDSKDDIDTGELDTTNLRHSGVSTIKHAESISPNRSAPVTGRNATLRDVPAGRAPTTVTLRDDLQMLHRHIDLCSATMRDGHDLRTRGLRDRFAFQNAEF